jgi:DNA repair protein RecN (Recombination protein N)
MLTELTISNFAIISHLDIHFKPGLNILSGETGAGKSIIISAVNLILGGRAHSDLIRTGSDEARVEALFSLPAHPLISTVVGEMGFPFDGELVIRRQISREGRNRILINESLATLQMLSKIGNLLISISGQHEHQLLLKPENHLYLLDDFGGLAEERLRLNTLFIRYQSLLEKRSSLQRKIREMEERQELEGFQRDEIDKADLKEDEDNLLEREKKRLQHAEQVRGLVEGTYQTLYEKEGSVLSELSACVKRLNKGVEMDPELKSVMDILSSAKVQVEEVALDLRDRQESILIDPHRLDEVEERLQVVLKLKRKYGSSLEEIKKFRNQLSQKMESLGQNKEEEERMNREIKESEAEIVSKASLLSGKRKETARNFEEAIKSELDLLDMKGTRFQVEFHQDAGLHVAGQKAAGKIRADGWDQVEFILSSNIGEDLKPLSKIASGGELSRIMLAMKTILARTASVETIIFDEVDSGIGGATAQVVGEKLRGLADFNQVICITHLPQIASKGSTHFLVRKRVVDGRTGTTISELNREERVKEIARLLGGKTITQKAIAHAKEILG